MVENLIWMKDTDPLGKIEMRSPAEFFERTKKEARDLAVWIGELVRTFSQGHSIS